MALFSSNQKQEQKQDVKKVHPTVMKTQNVAKEIVEFAKRNDVEASTLDFNIFEIQTYTRISDGKDNEWKDVVDESNIHFDDTTILNNKFEIKQIYEIEIFSKEQDSIFKNFHTAIGANATKCKIYLTIKASSVVEYMPNFDEELLKYINKAKVRAGILINIFDEMLFDVVSKLSAKVKVNGMLQFDSNQTILIAEGYEPTPTINDELILHYEKEQQIDENSRVYYSDRGFIKSVVEGEILIEYIKPKKGKPGRNCRGEYIEANEPTAKNAPTFSVDNASIDIQEDDKGIIYRSKHNGYVAKDGNSYIVKSDMDVSEISFKTTGSIYAGVDSDVALSVKESDFDRDAIGNGMVVEVGEIDIKGNVGSNAKVCAKRVNIEGQTHKTSQIKADDITINIHKGSAVGDNIKVSRLEHGIIEGKKVTLTQAMGGTIMAREISMEICASYVKAIASKKIVINKLQGSENVFIIDPLMQSDSIEKFEKNKDEILELQNAIKEINREIKKYEILVKDNTIAFNDVKKRILHYKQNGIKVPVAFVEKYRQLTKVIEHLEYIKDELNQKNEKLFLLTSKSATLQDSITDARIINRDKWIGHNEIIFKLIEPKIELVYKPPEGSIEKVFGVVQDKDGNFEIRAVSE